MNTKYRFALASLVLSFPTAGIQAQEATRLGGAPSDTRTPVPQAKLPSNVVKGSGTTGKIPKWTGSGTLGNSVLTESGGKIGVGTASPSAKLEVAGTARITDTLTLAPSGDQALNVSTGSIYKGGTLFIHTKGGSDNTALGSEALANVTTGNSNTASGHRALFSNTTGYDNTSVGYRSLYSNTTGFANTASGDKALYSNTTGTRNTASGYSTLRFNSTGNRNTASGAKALQSNTTGEANTATGYGALQFNTTGYRNTAFGQRALFKNSTGGRNTATGSYCMLNNTTGIRNTGSGYLSLRLNDTGSRNTGDGFYSLGKNVSGNNNIGIGHFAGSDILLSDNIAIGNYGSGTDSGVIRVGTNGTHAKAFIAGIRGVTTGNADAVTVLIDSAGQLGTISSSRRFKDDIRDMGDATDRLLDLRAVLFRYKGREGPDEYGLIAEEVAEVFPELVVYDEEGRPETVKYHLLGTMLLNEMQKERARNENRDTEVAELQVHNESLRVEVASLSKRLAVLEQRE